MATFARIGLRARLALALVAMAVLSVGTATVLANIGLPERVNDAADARLERQTTHLAALAAAFYGEQDRWARQHVLALEHLAEMSGLQVELASGGRRLSAPLSPVGGSRTTASAPVVADGRVVGTLRAGPAGRSSLTPEEEHLRHSLDRLHLAAAAISVLAALGLAFVLAYGLAGPLRRIRAGAERLAAGDLSVRVDTGGGPEIASVAKALNVLTETLAQEERLRRESVGDLSHELRTPVNALLGRIEAAEDGILAPETNLEAMHVEALRLSRLLDDLARLADAEQPGLLLEKREVDLARLALDATDRWRSAYTERGIALSAHASEATVGGDADRLSQIADNLLANALRYTDGGGRVEIRVRRAGDEALLEIADTGIGIAQEDLPWLFTRFWRGEKSRSRATGGAGIGLSIVAALVRAHGGTVEVESHVGEGSTFRVRLPALPHRPAPRVLV